MNKWTRRFEWKTIAPSGARGRVPDAPHYFAFLSYSHQDRADADWLHEQLEAFRIPSSLAGRLTAHGVIPKRLSPIFRDQHDLAAGHDLSDEIQLALAGSRCLIVLCSPAAAASEWTNAEIDCFRRLHPEACIIAAVLSGEPLAGEIRGREKEECFPPALLTKYDRRGRPTGKSVEPLAADLRGTPAERRTGLLKIIAGVLGVGLDDLVQRDHLRRQRRLAAITGGSLIGMVGASILAVTAIQARDEARDQRRQAESLVEFMLGDLKDKLEPIGRLDALDGVGSRVLDYYKKQDMSQLSDEGLAQRSKALTLMGQIASLRGDLNRASDLYRQAYAGTAEAVRRNPEDPQPLYDHAQNVFYLGDVARQRGDLKGVEAAAREYKALSKQMVALDPNNMKWRMEEQDADVNLGIALQSQRRFPEASAQFQEALGSITALATADPANRDYQISVTEALAWLADARIAEGRLDAAIDARRRQVQILQGLNSRGSDVAFRQKLIPAQQALGRLLDARGETAAAQEQLTAATTLADALIPMEPSNSKWLQYSATAHLSLAKHLLSAGKAADASSETRKACDVTSRLLAMDKTVVDWRSDRRTCLALQAQLALAAGQPGQAIALAKEALSVATSTSRGDPVDRRYAVAKSERQLGDLYRASGDKAAARASWERAYANLPGNIAERPWEMSERAQIAERLGRVAEAQRLNAALAALGIKRSDLLKVV